MTGRIFGGGRRGLALTAVAAALALSGMGAVAWGVSQQTSPPMPPASAAGTIDLASPTPTPPASAAASPTPTAPAGPAVLPASRPVSIDIPAIHVTSTLQTSGLNADGTIQTPVMGPHYDEASWYKYSPTPGQRGPAVIVGHIDSKKKGPSVFYRLGDLRPGDTVTVTRADGIDAVFTVNAVREFPKDDFPTLVVYGDTDHAALRLITCGGSFNSKIRHYRDNIVVFAHLTGQHPDAASAAGAPAAS